VIPWRLLTDGIDIGLLELNTLVAVMNGTVTATDANSFNVQVGQSFGNCPQYIQARMFELNTANSTTLSLGPRRCRLTRFFIATAFEEKKELLPKGRCVASWR